MSSYGIYAEGPSGKRIYRGNSFSRIFAQALIDDGLLTPEQVENALRDREQGMITAMSAIEIALNALDAERASHNAPEMTNLARAELAELRKDRKRLDAMISNAWGIIQRAGNYIVLSNTETCGTGNTPREAIDDALENSGLELIPEKDNESADN